MNLFLNYYNRYNLLHDNELKILPLILKALAAMYIIQTSYINSTSGSYLENDYWLSEGRKFLIMNINRYDLDIN